MSCQCEYKSSESVTKLFTGMKPIAIIHWTLGICTPDNRTSWRNAVAPAQTNNRWRCYRSAVIKSGNIAVAYDILVNSWWEAQVCTFADDYWRLLDDNTSDNYITILNRTNSLMMRNRHRIHLYIMQKIKLIYQFAFELSSVGRNIFKR